MGFVSRFLRNKNPESELYSDYESATGQQGAQNIPAFDNAFERKWLNLIPPEHRQNLRRLKTLIEAEQYFDYFVPEVPKRVRRFCWLHA